MWRKILVLLIILLFLGIAPALAESSKQQGSPSSNTPVSPAYAPDRLLVKYKTDMVPQQDLSVARETLHSRTGASVMYDYANLGLPGLELVNIHGKNLEDTIRVYEQSPMVAYAEPDYLDPLPNDTLISSQNTVSSRSGGGGIPNDTYFDQLWGLHNTGQDGGMSGADIDALGAWNSTTGSKNTIIAVFDTGVNYTHQDLAGNMWINTGEIPNNSIDDDHNGYVDDYRGYAFDPMRPDPNDEMGHGTHVAGTIGAVGNNGMGVSGVNWNVSLMPLNVFNTTIRASYVSAQIQGILYANMMGARVISMSLGGTSYPPSMARYDAINSSSVVVVCAAGNAYMDNDIYPFYPASYNCSNIIAVASIDRMNNQSYFSNYGKTSVDLGAPGSDILSTYMDGSYMIMSGTSMATPHVSGEAGLILSQYPNLTNLQVIDRILASTDPVPDLAKNTVTGGRVNARKALMGVFQAPAVTGITPSLGLNNSLVQITNLSGTPFFHGAVVNLTRTGYVNITGINVNIDSVKKISCVLPLNGAAPGVWNVSVQNPDGQIGKLVNGFTISDPTIPDGYITATASEGGTIVPAGLIRVPSSGSQTFTMTPDQGFQIRDILINNASVGPFSTYTFTNVITNNTIHANFTLIPPSPGNYLIVASHDRGGIINPDGVITVAQNASLSFTMQAKNGYFIKSVLIDGAPIGQNTSYTFQRVSANHTISLNTETYSGVKILWPDYPTPEGRGYQYFNPNGNDPGYVILSPGTYYLSEGFTTSNMSAISIASPDVILDGTGETITCSRGSDGTEGISTNQVSNITVRNFSQIMGFSNGIYLYADGATVTNTTISSSRIGIVSDNNRNVTIEGNRIYNSTYQGLVNLHSLHNTIVNNTIIDSSDAGIQLLNSSGNIIGNRIVDCLPGLNILGYMGSGSGAIYNNYLGSAENVSGENVSDYSWTNPAGPQVGTNIIGGPYVAGNYWSNINGTGWSDQQPANASGYSTTPYPVAPGVNDTAPLVRVGNVTPTPTPTGTITPTPTPTQTPTPTPTPGDHYTINATSNDLGFILPSGLVSAHSGDTVSFQLRARGGAQISNLTVDGSPASVQTGNTYTFPNITGNHQISLNCTPKDRTVIPRFDANTTSDPAPLTVQFTDRSYGSPTRWFWKFGDGLNSTLQNPVHTYTTPGLKTVSLWARNLYSSSMVTKRGYLNVTSSGQTINMAEIASVVKEV